MAHKKWKDHRVTLSYACFKCRRSLASAIEQIGVLRTEKAALRAELASEAQRCKEQGERTLDERRRLEESKQSERAITAELEGV